MEKENSFSTEIHSKEENKGKDFWVVFLNICLALVTIFLLGYIAYKNGYIDLDNILNTQEERTETDISVRDNGEITLEVFEGEAIEAILPEGWSIVEYFDGEGTARLPVNTLYTGLTGLEVYHNEKVVLELMAAAAVGFPECPELIVFSDTDPEYVLEVQELSRDFEMETIAVDYSDVEYSEFEWFGRYFRRIDNMLYFDSNSTTETFDTQCETAVVSLPLLSFSNTEGERSSVYFYTISEDATPEELKLLDGILASMLVIE